MEIEAPPVDLPQPGNGTGMGILSGIGAIVSILAMLTGGVPPAGIVGVVSSTAIIEYGAAVVAVGIGIPAVPATVYVTLLGVTLMLFLFAALDTLADRSTTVRRLVGRAQRRAATIDRFRRWGPVALCLGVMVVGFYVCVPVAWLFGWPRYRSIIALSLGFFIGTATTAALSAGLLSTL
ncbi:MAG TPA: hypothetical protein PK089_09830 [Methanoregulaceae archaeon]|nr:hypothetical protein [Methanoregulaceae archaeon]HQJ87279.1 hypothetical protein [Methanoregulaceae archaeon]